MRQNLPVAIFSLEMSKESLLMRLLASHGRVDAHNFRTGHLCKEDWRQMTTVARRAVAGADVDRRLRIGHGHRNRRQGAAAEARPRAYRW